MPLSRRGFLKTTLAGGIAAPAIARAATKERGMRRPNIVFILTDNQGAWTLGCYGNRDIRTPHIDRLAAEGMRFTRAFANNAVCSPTRATLLTGLMPCQHGVHCYLRAGRAQMGPDAYCTIKEFRTLPEVLTAAGYACGLVGKWHLGANLHPQESFTYWITKPHGHTTAFYDVPIIHEGKVTKVAKYTTELWTEHAVEFIEQNRERPFFLFLAFNGPYGLGGSLLKPARNRHAAYYADKTLPCFPRRPIHPWQHNNREYINNPQAMRRYAAECSGVDDVGHGRPHPPPPRLRPHDAHPAHRPPPRRCPRRRDLRSHGRQLRLHADPARPPRPRRPDADEARVARPRLLALPPR